MGVLAIADLVLALMGKLNTGLEEGTRFYRAIRAKYPDMPDRTDAEVIQVMKAGFQGNVDDIKATLAALSPDDN